MSVNDRPDELQQLWKSDDDAIVQERIPMIMDLVLEKAQSYSELVTSEWRRRFKLALLMGPVATYLAFRTTLLPVRIGWGIVAIVCVWELFEIYKRRMHRVPTPDQDARAYCQKLLTAYDQRIRAMEQLRWYILVPMVLLVGLVVWPYLSILGSLFLAIGTALLWLQISRYGADAATDLRRRRQEVVSLLQQMEES